MRDHHHSIRNGDKCVLQGITWGHSRGITPLQACSQRFNELHPHVEIHWEKRTLQDFADFPLEVLAENYDLLIIDHPWVGTAAKTKCVLPLDEYLPETLLDEQRLNSTGASFSSYEYQNHLWALPIDAAAPAACYRADLFKRAGRLPPQKWSDLIGLAKEGRVVLPGIPVDTILHFIMFCISLGEEPFSTANKVISAATGQKALHHMRELWSLCDREIFYLNPIDLAEKMSSSDAYWYCPFAFCYSNYSRAGFSTHPLTYGNMVQLDSTKQLKSVLGGTGLAVSTSTSYKTECLAFVSWIVSGIIQQTLYGEHGGQPAHRTAWTNDRLNMLANQYFQNTLPVIQSAYTRPRYDGFLDFQDQAGTLLWNHMFHGSNTTDLLMEIDSIYRQSRLEC